MSDFSLLYKKYNSVSNLTNDLNKSVITLKRRDKFNVREFRLKYPDLLVTDDEVVRAKKLLIEILSLLEKFYNEQEINSKLYELMDNSLFQSQILKNVVFKDNISRVLGKLRSDKNLSAKELTNIDKFISILDNEAAVLFRKLRTSR